MSAPLASDLDAGDLARELDRFESPVGRPVAVVGVTASTNDDARRAAAAGAPHGAVFVADAQTNGRGRGRHAWHSPPGENLYLSLLLRPNLPAAKLAPLALVAGIAVARALESLLPPTFPALRIKWPNDVLAGERKLAGVLVEAQLRGPVVASVVIGIGINVRSVRFPGELASRATSLALLGAPRVARSTLAARVLAELGKASGLFEATGLSAFVAELSARDALRGREVDVGGVRGVGEGIDPRGFLLVRDASGTLHAVGSGEAKLLGTPI